MSLQAIGDGMLALLQTVNGVGRVHSYIRAANTEKGFKDIFVDENGKILCWSLTRESTEPMPDTLGCEQDLHQIVLRGWMGIEDANATERTFQYLIESVREVFRIRENRKLNGAAQWIRQTRVRLVMSGMIGGYMVHYCEIVVPVEDVPIAY